MTNPNNPAVARAGADAEKSRLGLSHLCGAMSTCCVREPDHHGVHVNCRGQRIGRWITDSRQFGTPPMRPWECGCPGAPDLIDARTDYCAECGTARPPLTIEHAAVAPVLVHGIPMVADPRVPIGELRWARPPKPNLSAGLDDIGVYAGIGATGVPSWSVTDELRATIRAELVEAVMRRRVPTAPRSKSLNMDED